MFYGENEEETVQILEIDISLNFPDIICVLGISDCYWSLSENVRKHWFSDVSRGYRKRLEA